MKNVERDEARRLRGEQGCSIKEIAKKLNVSIGSVSLWVRDIELTDEQKTILESKNPRYNNQIHGSIARKQQAMVIRKGYQNEGADLAMARNSDFIAGCMLYWGEGDKSRNVVGLSNTDENMLRFFVDFLKKWFGVIDDEFSITVNWYSDNGESLEGVQNFWTNHLGLPSSCVRKFQKDNVSKYSLKKKTNTHHWGTCHVRVGRTDIVQKIYGAIQEFVGFKNEKWIL